MLLWINVPQFQSSGSISRPDISLVKEKKKFRISSCRFFNFTNYLKGHFWGLFHLSWPLSLSLFHLTRFWKWLLLFSISSFWWSISVQFSEVVFKMCVPPYYRCFVSSIFWYSLIEVGYQRCCLGPHGKIKLTLLLRASLICFRSAIIGSNLNLKSRDFSRKNKAHTKLHTFRIASKEPFFLWFFSLFCSFLIVSVKTQIRIQNQKNNPTFYTVKFLQCTIQLY